MAGLVILGIELEIHHGIASQYTRLENLNLVLDTSRITHKSEVLHVGQHLVGRTAATTIIVLNQHLGRYLVVLGGIAQIDECAAHADEHRQQEPLPIEHQHRKKVLERKHRLFVLKIGQILTFVDQF